MDLSKLDPRFRDKVILQRYTNCWLWAGGVDRDGYGQYSVKNKSLKAHRVAFQQLRGPIPEGMTIDHGCRNTSCVNPSHMEPMTSGDNVRRGLSFSTVNRNKTHCINGHALTGDNVKLVKNGRCCRVCQLESARKHKRRPDVVAANRDRQRTRYQTDPAYREKAKARALANYHKQQASA